MSSVYTSDQYQILLDLSGLLTAAMTDSIFSRTVEESLSSKINRDKEILFFTAPSSNNYYTSISAAGIEIVPPNIIKPSISLAYKDTE